MRSRGSSTLSTRQTQTFGGTSYAFGSWSDGGAQSHTIVTPNANQSYVATFQASAAPPAIAAYAFNEGSGTSAADASGNGLTGTLTNGAAWGTGRNMGAVLLDGVNDFVELGNPLSLQLTGSMTVSAWVNSAAFPLDDAAIVSKRASGEIGYQLDTTIDRGPRTIGFKLTNSSGANMFRYGATSLQANTWYFVTGVYDAATSVLHVYLNGQLDDGTLLGTVTATQRNSTANVNIGRRPSSNSFNFNGRIDDVRIYNRALTPAEIQTDMNTPVAAGSGDPTPPTAPATLTATAVGPTQVNLSWSAATDNVAVTGYRVERCQGATCTTFAEIAAPSGTGTTYNDTVRRRQQHLPLPRPRHRRCHQPRPLQPYRQRHHPDRDGRYATDGTGDPDRDRGRPDAGQPLLVGGDRQRRGHRLPRRALPRRRLYDLRRDRRSQRHRHHVQRHAASPTAPTATASAPPTPPPTSAPTARSPTPPPRPRRTVRHRRHRRP